MIKALFSFLMIFSFLCLSAQENDSLKGNEIQNIVFIRESKDCKKDYNEEKKLYEKQVQELNTFNFETLFDELFKLEEFHQINSDSRKILVLNLQYITITYGCGNSPYYECQHFEKNISDVVIIKLWSKNNFKKVQNFFNNKMIIPLLGMPFSSFEDNMKIQKNYLVNYKIKTLYKGTYNDLENKNQTFYYSSNQKFDENVEIKIDKNKILVGKYLNLNLNIFPTDHKNLSNVYLVKFLISDEEKNIVEKQLFYQYKNKKWITLDENI
ncbi:hypothetical protein [Epilithonimonas mollis]|uniref:Uncharacterized protein n=1 Tax=Epilithonimonas mollis TaxID=216903 RepID=A0A1M6QXT1_9FLAO|nr:hypothetical protein [Epilithonimonas mollis]SHK25004.1 hypothetical protein SAMN05444371_1575 [Epilithonimonas mollis]